MTCYRLSRRHALVRSLFHGIICRNMLEKWCTSHWDTHAQVPKVTRDLDLQAPAAPMRRFTTSRISPSPSQTHGSALGPHSLRTCTRTHAVAAPVTPAADIDLPKVRCWSFCSPACIARQDLQLLGASTLMCPCINTRSTHALLWHSIMHAISGVPVPEGSGQGFSSICSHPKQVHQAGRAV